MNKPLMSLVFSLIVSHSLSTIAVANNEVEGTKSPSKATQLASKNVKIPTESTALIIDQSNPYTMIKDVADKTFSRFANESVAIKGNPNLLKDIVREELMPYINYKYSAFKVIGKHLKKTTKEDRAAFIPVFREYLISSYAQAFTLYDNQTIEFEPEKSFEGKKIIAVNTRIIMTGRDNIDVAFKVRLNKKTKSWQAFDLVAEGVSLLDSKQAELSNIIRQKGLPYVTDLLKKKSNQDVSFKSDSAQNIDTAVKKMSKAK